MSAESDMGSDLEVETLTPLQEETVQQKRRKTLKRKRQQKEKKELQLYTDVEEIKATCWKIQNLLFELHRKS